MADIYSILAGGLDSQDDYLARDPYFSSARALAQSEVAPTSSTSAFLIPLLKGLGTGVLAGKGIKNANVSAYEDYRNSPLLKGLPEYQSETMPEDWTIRQGQQSGILQALAGQQAQERALQELKVKQTLNANLAKQGMQLTDTGEIAPIEGYSDIVARNAAAKAGGEIEGRTGTLGYNPVTEEETDKLRKEFSGLEEVKNFSKIKTAAGIISEAIKDDNAVTDLELTRYSILLIEPGMAVREGEQAAVANSQSIPTAWKGEIEKAMTGKSKLSPEIREGLKGLAARAYKGNKGAYDKALNFYQEQAKLKGLDPNRISYIGEAPSAETVMGTNIAQKMGVDGKMYNVRDLGNGQFEILD